jgi:hypothetical protein
MLHKYFLSFLCLVIFLPAYSQELEDPYRFSQVSNLDFDIRQGALLMQLDYHHVHRLNPENRFRMGYGVALMQYRGFNDVDYRTKEAEQDINLGLDTLQVENPSIAALNLFLLVNYAPNDRVDFGFAIDVVGVGWGKPQDAVLASGPEDPQPVGAIADPVNFNSSLFSSGSWRSQFHLRYWLFPRIALHTGLTYWTSAYEVQEDLNLEQDVFTHRSFLWRVGLSFRWGYETF